MQNSSNISPSIVTRKSYTRRSTEQWQALITLSEQSSLSDKEFCIEHKINTSSFYKWRKALQIDSLSPDFINITAAIDPPVKPLNIDWQVEIELGNGVILRVKAG